MKKIHLLIIISYLFSSGSCTEQNSVIPTADFDFEVVVNGINRTRIPTFEPLKIIDKSNNGDQYFWDFGNGETSTEKEPAFYYSTSGDYTITLIVTSSTGDNAKSTKNITIADRMLKDIELKYLNWDCLGDFPSWGDDKTADVFVEIRKAGTLYYKSPIITEISERNVPRTISVDESILMNPMDLVAGSLSFRLIAIDNAEEHIIFRSDVSGGGCASSGNGNSYSISTGIGGTTIYFNSTYR